MPKARYERDQRLTQIAELLYAAPDCYFTAGMVAREIGLKRSPYLIGLLDEIVSWPDSPVLKIPVVRLGKKAWGYMYAVKFQQQPLPCL